MKPNEFYIDLSSKRGGYYPGQLISGNVICNFDSSVSIQGITVTFIGKAETHWSNFRANEEYFNDEFQIIGHNKKGIIKIPSGIHFYPFTYTLPLSLPSSFEGDKGSVVYMIKASLDVPGGIDRKTEKYFILISKLNLNDFPNAGLPIRIVMKKTFNYCCCKSRQLTIDVGLPKSGYCSGETLPVVIMTGNDTKISFNDIIIKLIKIVGFHGSRKTKNKTKLFSFTIASVRTGRILPKSTKSFVRELKIPVMPPCNLQKCGIIDLNYKLKVICIAPGCREDMEDSSPIFIGTVPLDCKVVHTVEVHNPITPQTTSLFTNFSKSQNCKLHQAEYSFRKSKV